MQRRTRRRVLSTTGALIAAGLAGCSSNGEDGTEPEPTTAATTVEDPVTETETQTETTAEDDVTQIVVAPNGDFRFAPDDVTVASGETVEWVWSGGGHNVVVESKPDGSDWDGTEGSSSKTYASGHTHEHTFETPGSYSYYCQPHRGSGMGGSLTVE